MMYLISQILLFLILASMLGILVGWWARRNKHLNDISALNQHWQGQVSMTEKALEQEQDKHHKLEARAQHLESSAAHFRSTCKGLQTTLQDRDERLSYWQSAHDAVQSKLKAMQSPAAPKPHPSIMADALRDSQTQIQQLTQELEAERSAQQRGRDIHDDLSAELDNLQCRVQELEHFERAYSHAEQRVHELEAQIEAQIEAQAAAALAEAKTQEPRSEILPLASVEPASEPYDFDDMPEPGPLPEPTGFISSDHSSEAVSSDAPPSEPPEADPALEAFEDRNSEADAAQPLLALSASDPALADQVQQLETQKAELLERLDAWQNRYAELERTFDQAMQQKDAQVRDFWEGKSLQLVETYKLQLAEREGEVVALERSLDKLEQENRDRHLEHAQKQRYLNERAHQLAQENGALKDQCVQLEANIDYLTELLSKKLGHKKPLSQRANPFKPGTQNPA